MKRHARIGNLVGWLRAKSAGRITSRGLLREALFLLLAIATAWVCLLPVTRHASWPTNHDNVNAKLRTQIYAHHLKQGDLLPVWSVSDGYGLGSPMPLYYQKTFFYTSGLVYLWLDDIKDALVWSIGIWLVIGAYGMRFAVRKLTARPLLCFLVPQAFLLSNYVFTDWLVRGAVAEFCAVMLVPWLLWWCLRLLQDRAFSWTIVPIFILLFGAHNAILATSLGLIVGAYLLYLHQEGWRVGLRRTFLKGSICAAIVAALLSPILVAQVRFNADYAPTTKISGNGLTPMEQVHPLGEYFWDAHYVWLREWSEYTVQLDFGAWTLVAVLTITVTAALFTKRWRRQFGRYFDRRVVLFLLASFAVYLFMQTKLSASVYSLLPQLKALQFPWRLLAFLTPIALLVAAVCFEAAYRKVSNRFVTGVAIVVWLASFLVLSPVFRQFQYSFYPSAYFDTQIAPNSPDGSGMVQGGEYVPRTLSAEGKELAISPSYFLYRDLHDEGRLSGALDGTPCNLVRLPDESFESLTMRFRLSCDGPTIFALPLSYSRYMRLYDMTDGKRQTLGYRREIHDPRVLIDVGSRPMEVLVEVPTLAHVLFGRAQRP